MVKLVKNYIYNILYAILAIIIPLITAPYLTRMLGSNALGIYGYVNSIILMLSQLIMVGTYEYSIRQIAYVRDNKERLDETFWNLSSIRFVLASIGTVIYFLWIFVIGKYTIFFLVYYTYLLSCFIDCTWLFIGMEDMKWAVTRNVITKVIAFLCIFLFLKSKDDLIIYFLIQGGAALISSFLAYIKLFKYVNRPRYILCNFKKTVHDSFLLFLPSIAASLYLQCDKVMIELITGNSCEVAFYDYAEKLVMIPITAITCLNSVIMPRMANQFKKGNKNYIQNMVSTVANIEMLFACPLTMLMITIANKAIPWYLGAEFSNVAINLQIISLIIITNSLTGISGNQYFTATNQVKKIFFAQSVTAIENIVLNAIMIPIYGSKGTAIATVFSCITCALIQYYFLLKQIRIAGFVKVLVKYFLMSCISAIVVSVVTLNMNPTFATTLIQTYGFIIIYLLECLLIKDRQLKKIIEVLFSMLRKDN